MMIVHRKGVALLWVVLTSALILVAIVGISMRIVPQKQLANAANYTQRALAVAESGLAEATFKLRSQDKDFLDQLDPTKTAAPKYDSGVQGFDSGVGTDDSTYRVVVKPASSGGGYVFYSLGTFGPQDAPLARQAISVRYSINFPFGKYALYSEKKIDLQNGTISGGGVYGDVVDIKNGSLTGGTAYYTSSGSVPSGTLSQQVAEVSFPTISMGTYRDQWNAFLNGTYSGFIINALGGTDGGLSYDAITRLYSGAAYQSATTGTGKDKRAAGFEELFREIKNPSLAPATYYDAAVALKTQLTDGNLTFDIKPNTSGGEVDFSDAQLFSTAPYLQGVIIVEGDLKLSSNNLQIGVVPSKTAVLVSGMCTVGNAATINGFLYIAGEGKHGNDPLLSCKASGGLTVNGSIVAKGTISANSAGLSVTWQDNDVYTNELGKVPPPSAVPSSWRQISYDEFLKDTQ